MMGTDWARNSRHSLQQQPGAQNARNALPKSLDQFSQFWFHALSLTSSRHGRYQSTGWVGLGWVSLASLTGCLAGWLPACLAGCLPACLAAWLAALLGWLAGWLPGWLLGWLAAWLAGCPPACPADRLPCTVPGGTGEHTHSLPGQASRGAKVQAKTVATQ